ncbi:hypothetical protein P9112_008679 [Eukaryota sp. TZLM1-RC]
MLEVIEAHVKGGDRPVYLQRPKVDNGSKKKVSRRQKINPSRWKKDTYFIVINIICRMTVPTSIPSNTLLTHIAIHTSSIEQSICFYQKYCNLKVLHERPGMGDRIVWMGDNDNKCCVFVLLPGRKTSAPEFPVPQDISHYGFACPSQARVDEIAEHAKNDNILVFGPKQMSPPTNYICIVRSPEGRNIEFSYGQDWDIIQ